MMGATTTLEETGISIHLLHDTAELRACEDLQRRIWGYSETDIAPESIFKVAEHSGGQVLGATHQGKLAGFALSFAARREGCEYLHSHMVGVVPEYQDRGVGRLLKFAQRDHAIAQGIGLIEWTFDPLQLKNAHFNLARLGAICRRYLPNCYGRTSSPLHAGLPTDRLVAEWWVQSKRVEDRLQGKKRAAGTQQTRISLPAEIREICSHDPQRAEVIQSQLREQFEDGFARGQVAVGFEFDQEKGSYILEPYEN
jgi:predicted GNAT superfamily acetyltransferase